jgi:hypothetical protein
MEETFESSDSESSVEIWDVLDSDLPALLSSSPEIVPTEIASNIPIPNRHIMVFVTEAVEEQYRVHFVQIQVNVAVLIHCLIREGKRAFEAEWEPGAAIDPSCLAPWLAIDEEYDREMPIVVVVGDDELALEFRLRDTSKVFNSFNSRKYQARWLGWVKVEGRA